MNTQFKKGVIEMCVIHLISEQDMYGFAVIEALSKEIDVNENTVYPILRRLTDQGYFETYTEATNVGAPRKYFRITEAGKNRNSEYQADWNDFLKGVSRILGGRENEK
ncbi:MAG: PadR family transcriptional regulator [Candidatus Izemoplasmatales bacterium]|nr:PadR family transcriptional regulator [Candidatus Izemoplasmatales bacterium]